MKYVLDTNIINWLVDKRIDRTELPENGGFVATHIQVDEINRTSNEERHAQLSLTILSMKCDLLPTETTILDVSRFEHCKLGNGAIYSSVKKQLDAKNGGRLSNICDALIAEVAIANEFTLITADADLAVVTENHHGTVRLFAPRP